MGCFLSLYLLSLSLSLCVSLPPFLSHTYTHSFKPTQIERSSTKPTAGGVPSSSPNSRLQTRVPKQTTCGTCTTPSLPLLQHPTTACALKPCQLQVSV